MGLRHGMLRVHASTSAGTAAVGFGAAPWELGKLPLQLTAVSGPSLLSLMLLQLQQYEYMLSEVARKVPPIFLVGSWSNIILQVQVQGACYFHFLLCYTRGEHE
jgi:hypothetical protein